MADDVYLTYYALFVPLLPCLRCKEDTHHIAETVSRTYSILLYGKSSKQVGVCPRLGCTLEYQTSFDIVQTVIGI